MFEFTNEYEISDENLNFEEQYKKYNDCSIIVLILFILSFFIPLIGIYNYYKYHNSFNSINYHFARCSIFATILNLMFIFLISAIIYFAFYKSKFNTNE